MSLKSIDVISERSDHKTAVFPNLINNNLIINSIYLY
jgi:hypothetical protein